MSMSVRRFLSRLILSILLLSNIVNAQQLLFTEIEKHSKENWTVSYQSLQKPLKQSCLQFRQTIAV